MFILYNNNNSEHNSPHLLHVGSSEGYNIKDKLVYIFKTTITHCNWPVFI